MYNKQRDRSPVSQGIDWVHQQTEQVWYQWTRRGTYYKGIIVRPKSPPFAHILVNLLSQENPSLGLVSLNYIHIQLVLSIEGSDVKNVTITFCDIHPFLLGRFFIGFVSILRIHLILPLIKPPSLLSFTLLASHIDPDTHKILCYGSDVMQSYQVIMYEVVFTLNMTFI